MIDYLNNTWIISNIYFVITYPFKYCNSIILRTHTPWATAALATYNVVVAIANAQLFTSVLWLTTLRTFIQVIPPKLVPHFEWRISLELKQLLGLLYTIYILLYTFTTEPCRFRLYTYTSNLEWLVRYSSIIYLYIYICWCVCRDIDSCHLSATDTTAV